jgi:hypothetical protein
MKGWSARVSSQVINVIIAVSFLDLMIEKRQKDLFSMSKNMLKCVKGCEAEKYSQRSEASQTALLIVLVSFYVLHILVFVVKSRRQEPRACPPKETNFTQVHCFSWRASWLFF